MKNLTVGITMLATIPWVAAMHFQIETSDDCFTIHSLLYPSLIIPKNPSTDSSHPEQLIVRGNNGKPLLACMPRQTPSLKKIWSPIYLFNQGNVFQCAIIPQDGLVSFEKIKELNICILKIEKSDSDDARFLIIDMDTGTYSYWCYSEFLGYNLKYRRLISRVYRPGHDELRILDVKGMYAIRPIHIGDSRFEGVNEFSATDGKTYTCVMLRDGRDQKLYLFDLWSGAQVLAAT